MKQKDSLFSSRRRSGAKMCININDPCFVCLIFYNCIDSFHILSVYHYLTTRSSKWNLYLKYKHDRPSKLCQISSLLIFLKFNHCTEAQLIYQGSNENTANFTHLLLYIMENIHQFFPCCQYWITCSKTPHVKVHRIKFTIG